VRDPDRGIEFADAGVGVAVEHEGREAVIFSVDESDPGGVLREDPGAGGGG
jgi:hypothetical protein